MNIDINFMNQEGFSIVKAQLITLTNLKKTPHFIWMHIRLLKNIILVLAFVFNSVPGTRTYLVRPMPTNSA